MTRRDTTPAACAEHTTRNRHTHTCTGWHLDDGGHYCRGCRRWWWHNKSGGNQ